MHFVFVYFLRLIVRVCFFAQLFAFCVRLPLHQADTDEEKTMDSSDEDSSEYSSDIFSLTLEEQGPEMVVLGTLRKVCVCQD